MDMSSSLPENDSVRSQLLARRVHLFGGDLDDLCPGKREWMLPLGSRSTRQFIVLINDAGMLNVS